jgi:hypothetical protein
MGYEYAARLTWRRTQPIKNLASIGMCRGCGELDYLGANRHILSIDSDRRGACGDGGTSSASGLESAQDYGISRIRRECNEMVQDTPSGDHSACRDDHHWALATIERFGFLRAGNHPGHPLEFIQPGAVDAMKVGVLPIQIGDTSRHGAVQVHGYGRDLTSALQLRDDVKQKLRTTYGECWDHHDSAAGSNTTQDLTQLFLESFRGVRAVAISGFGDDPVRIGWGRRWDHDRIMRSAQVSAKGDASVLVLERYRCGAENVALWMQAGFNSWYRLESLVERYASQLPQAPIGVFFAV